MAKPVMELVDILKYLPHRYPFLLVDRVVEIDEDSILAYKNVTFNENFFQGHFPDKPIMPGVLILEALAQAGVILAFHRDGSDTDGKLLLFTGIDGVKFRRPVVPGDCLMLKIVIIRQRLNIWKMKATATVDGDLVAEGILTAAIVDGGAK